MYAQRGWERTFPISVVVAICAGGRQLYPAKPVDMGEAAEVNEHLFPISGRSMGLMVAEKSQRLSAPEIFRQHPELMRLDLANMPIDEIHAKIGDRIKLVSTGE